MQTVRTLTGKTITLEVEVSDTIDTLDLPFLAAVIDGLEVALAQL